MAFVRLTDSAPTPPPGYRTWNAAERDRLDALLAEVDAATAMPAKATARAKGDDNFGWDRIVAAVMDHRRVKADRG